MDNALLFYPFYAIEKGAGNGRDFVWGVPFHPCGALNMSIVNIP
jgi:hypothetical protein